MIALYGSKPPYRRVPTSLISYESIGPMARTFKDMVILQKYTSNTKFQDNIIFTSKIRIFTYIFRYFRMEDCL